MRIKITKPGNKRATVVLEDDIHEDGLPICAKLWIMKHAHLSDIWIVDTYEGSKKIYSKKIKYKWWECVLDEFEELE